MCTFKLVELLQDEKIQIGYQAPGKIRKVEKEMLDRTCYLINLKDLNETGGINPMELNMTFPLRNPELYSVSANDLLFVAKGGNFRTICLSSEDLNVFPKVSVLASSAFYILRITEQSRRYKSTTSESSSGPPVYPPYLAWFLNRAETQKKITEMARGRGVQHVRKRDLQDLQVRLPSWDTQKRIADLAEEFQREKTETREYLAAKENMIEKMAEYAIATDLDQ